jgi:hypothetical protein
MLSAALFQSGVVLPNGEMSAQHNAGAEQFTVQFWSDIPDTEADIGTDNAAVFSTPQKITPGFRTRISPAAPVSLGPKWLG